jgi:hypothetical protein
MEGADQKGVKRQERSAHPLSYSLYNLYTASNTRQTDNEETVIVEKFRI